MRIAWLDKKRARRGWVLLIAASLAGVIFFGLGADNLMAYDAGFVLPDADWQLSSGDLPATWRQFQNSHLFDRMVGDAPEVYSDVNVRMRHATGIRWTPLRWRLWFGRPAILMGIGDDVALTAKAKPSTVLLLRLARTLGLGERVDEHFKIAGHYVEKIGQFLVIATSPEAISKLRAEGNVWSSFGGGSAVSYSGRESTFSVTLIPQAGELEIITWVDQSERPDPERDQYFAIDWPQSPMVSVQSRGQSFDLESDVVSDWWARFPAHEDIDTAWSNFETLLPEGWRTGTDSVQFALFGVDTSDTIPIPDAAVYARSETPLEVLTPPVNAIPYEWSGVAGWMTPWKGEGANLFVVANDRARVFANEEATMAALMGRERAGRVSSEDASIDIDAPRLAKVLTNLARSAGKNELWPERNADDVEHDVLPWIRAFGALGTIHLEGHYENGSLVLRGGTQAPREEPSE